MDVVRVLIDVPAGIRVQSGVVVSVDEAPDRRAVVSVVGGEPHVVNGVRAVGLGVTPPHLVALRVRPADQGLGPVAEELVAKWEWVHRICLIAVRRDRRIVVDAVGPVAVDKGPGWRAVVPVLVNHGADLVVKSSART